MPGWFEAIAPAIAEAGTPSRPLTLAEFWPTLRSLRSVPGVTAAEPLLVVAVPGPSSAAAAARLAASFRRQQFGLWGLPYEAKIQEQIEAISRACESTGESCGWHLDQMKVGDAWRRWLEKHPGQLPGHGVRIGHPDTGFSRHYEVFARFDTPGKSFLRDNAGNEEPEALDDLRVVFDEFLETPGHGTATACVIASGERDRTAEPYPEAYGIAPGACVLPLRVSRSVLHLDFGNLARAIAYAAEQGVDVISMSLGGPWYSDFVRESIGIAQQHGVIIIAAAGNYLPATAFPAALPEVIAVAATNVAETPWRFSGIGRLVDIAAPGEAVWRAHAELGENGPLYTVTPGTGTSFAAACVAGLAALWVSYHGGRQEIAKSYENDLSLVPFAFQFLLEKTARTEPGPAAAHISASNKDGILDLVADGKHGAGIADADALLVAELPSLEQVKEFRQKIQDQPVNKLTFFAGLLTGGLAVTDATSAADDVGGLTGRHSVAQATLEHDAQQTTLRGLFGGLSDELQEELLPRLAADQMLLIGLDRWRPGESRLPLLDHLLGPRPLIAHGKPAPLPGLSKQLWEQLDRLRERELDALSKLHKGMLGTMAAGGSEAPTPVYRYLRAYSFDPSLGTILDTAPIYRVTIPVRWEPELRPGPIGEYLEVVDIDPASGCVYAPVDLNHPHVLSQEGLPLSEGNPQFHQQMVYAVAMNTINRFELALGRPVFW